MRMYMYVYFFHNLFVPKCYLYKNKCNEIGQNQNTGILNNI